MDVKPLTKINAALNPDPRLAEGLFVLAALEWVQLQAFCTLAIDDNPTTEQAMRQALSWPAAKAMEPEFLETTKVYDQLRSTCLVFREEIRPGMLQLASDIVDYQGKVDVVYKRLIGLINGYELDGNVKGDKLAELVKAWGSSAPSPANDIRASFVKFVGRLQQDAAERAKSASELKGKLVKFRYDLSARNGEFKRHLGNYRNLFGSASKELKTAQDDLKAAQDELDVAYKKQHDEMIVLSTSPLYLLVPFFGPLICAGVLLGVGIDYGLLVEKLKGKVERLDILTKNLGSKEAFFEAYQAATELTSKTHEDIEQVLPLVDKLELAWTAISSDLSRVQSLLTRANLDATDKDWELASANLEEAQQKWRALEKQADTLRRFGTAERVGSADELAGGQKAA